MGLHQRHRFNNEVVFGALCRLIKHGFDVKESEDFGIRDGFDLCSIEFQITLWEEKCWKDIDHVEEKTLSGPYAAIPLCFTMYAILKPTLARLLSLIEFESGSRTYAAWCLTMFLGTCPHEEAIRNDKYLKQRQMHYVIQNANLLHQKTSDTKLEEALRSTMEGFFATATWDIISLVDYLEIDFTFGLKVILKSRNVIKGNNKSFLSGLQDAGKDAWRG